MATFERHVDVDWQGSVMDGKGEAKAGSGAFSLPVTFPNRIGDANGKTSPEEMMAAAHAACYAMALNGTLGRKQASADRTVVRATVKGNVVVAAVQGALGGLAFWTLGVHAPILWAVVMGFLSLLPAIGAALIWAPVAIYLLAVGHVWQGIALILFSTFVIGLIDNMLRPILVGKDTQLPDYVILVSTLGGLAVIGINGFVIGPLIAAMFVAAWQLLATEHGRAEAD